MMNDYHPPADLLQGHHILVTGAGDGLGRAVARASAAHGATVILVGRTTAKLEQVYDEIESDGSPQPAIFPLDFASAGEAEYQGLAEALEREFGSLQGLVHCAALLKLLSRVDDYDLETWNKALQVNLTAPFLLTQTCLPLLRASENAAVVFTSDSLGRKGKAYWGAYAVAKFGIEGLMQVLADELETEGRIRVNSIDPGPMRSKIRNTAYPGEDPDTLPLPETVAPAFLRLLGADGRGLHGQSISLRP